MSIAIEQLWQTQSKISVAYRPDATFSNLAAASVSLMVASPLMISVSFALIPAATLPEPHEKNYGIIMISQFFCTGILSQLPWHSLDKSERSLSCHAIYDCKMRF